MCSFVTWGSVEVFYFKGKKHFEDTFNLPNTIYHVTVILVFTKYHVTPLINYKVYLYGAIIRNFHVLFEILL